MKAMVLAAGIGSRLKEFTRDTPKCLIEVGGKPMLEHVVERLKQAGVTELAINVHHLADKVIRFVQEKDQFGISVAFSEEATLLNSGGGLKKMRHFFEKESAFLIHNADVYCEAPLGELLERHRSLNAVATLAVTQDPLPRGLFFDASMRLVGWTEEGSAPPASATFMSFTGISVCSGEVFDFMDPRESFSILEPWLRAARSTSRVFGSVIPSESWTDMGTPEDLANLRRRLG